MNQIFFSTLLVCLFCFASCDKNCDKKEKIMLCENASTLATTKGHQSNAFTIDTVINSNQTFTLNLCPFQDRDDLVAIKSQASDYLVSELKKESNGAYVYSFQGKTIENPKSSTSNTQQVIIKIYEPSGHKEYEETLITLNITIQNNTK